MEHINYFFETLNKSNISLLGYSFKNERIKDEIISKIPHVGIEEIDSSFSFKTYLRDEKLKFLSEGSDSKLPKLFVLDINNITSKILIDKFSLIKNTISSIQDQMFSQSSQEPLFKLLITCPLQRSLTDSSINSFIGGNITIYSSDFVCAITDENTLHVIKNRHAYSEKKISLDGLKDFTYICDYENCQ